MVQWSWVEVWNRQYGPLGYTWANDPESGRRLVEGVYRPPRAEAPLPGTIEVELKGIKSAVDKKTGEVKILGKGETSEDWTLHIKIGDRLRMHGSGVPFDVVVTKISAPKYVGSAAKSKFIFGVLEFEFLDSPPTCDEAAATVAQVVVDCVVPRIPKDTKLDEMVKNRYLSGDVSTWDITTDRQAHNGLEPPGSGRYQLLPVAPSVNVRGMGYEQVNQVYADVHVAETLTDADYVEWIAQISESSTAPC